MSVNNEMLQKERIIARDYRNRRIGDFLKELQLTEGRSTGFPKIYKAMEQNGSPEPDFETDSNRSYFLAKLPIHSRLKERGQVKGQAAKKSLSDIEKAILRILEKGPSSRGEVLDALGMEKRTGYFRRIIDGLMDEDLIAYTIPDTPRHPDRKYKITDAGRRYIE